MQPLLAPLAARSFARAGRAARDYSSPTEIGKSAGQGVELSYRIPRDSGRRPHPYEDMIDDTMHEDSRHVYTGTGTSKG